MNKKTSHSSQGPLSERVRALVDRYFGGSVNAAAKAWAVPQSTVKRICDGTTTAPREKALERIARSHATSVEWLLRGGAGPNPLSEVRPVMMVQPDYERWDDEVISLGADGVTEDGLRELPDAVERASEIILSKLPRPRSRRDADAIGSAWTKAEQLMHKAWAVWLHSLIAAYGREAVRDAFKSELTRLLLGFSYLAPEIEGSDVAKREIARWVQRQETRHKETREFTDAVLKELGPDVDDRTHALALALAQIRLAEVGGDRSPKSVADQTRALAATGAFHR